MKIKKFNFKNLITLLAIIVLFFNLMPVQAGLVPCGASKDDPATSNINESKPCRFCDVFVLFDKVVRFVLFNLLLPVAVFMTVIAGVMFFTAAGDPGQISKATGILKSVVWGLIIIFGAWLLVNTFFLLIGISDKAPWQGLKGGWFKINCP